MTVVLIMSFPTVVRTVGLIGAEVKEGQDLFYGTENAPRELRHAGLLDVLVSQGFGMIDLGDVRAEVVPDEVNNVGGVYNSNEIKQSMSLGSVCLELHRGVKRLGSSDFILTIGGDHSVATGSISAIKSIKGDIGVVWVDAHSDCNTPETSPSGNYHGMPVAHLLGWFTKRAPGFGWLDEYLADPLRPDRIVYVGLRDVDEGESALLAAHGIEAYYMTEVDKFGISGVMERILAKFEKMESIHLSFDVDGIDPAVAPGTGTKCRGGLSYREAMYICSRLAESGKLGSMDLVEINPTLDIKEVNGRCGFLHSADSDVCHRPIGLIKEDATRTVRLGIELIGAAIGSVRSSDYIH